MQKNILGNILKGYLSRKMHIKALTLSKMRIFVRNLKIKNKKLKKVDLNQVNFN